MGTHNALISGSFAVQFFEGVTWSQSDLDIFVEYGSDADQMEDYICNVEVGRISNVSSLWGGLKPRNLAQRYA